MELFQDIRKCQRNNIPVSLSKTVQRLTSEIHNKYKTADDVNEENTVRTSQNTLDLRTSQSILDLPTEKGEEQTNTIV